MPESYFQLTVKNQASAIDAASEASGRAPHLLEKDTEAFGRVNVQQEIVPTSWRHRLKR